jgi:hypothetical protein
MLASTLGSLVPLTASGASSRAVSSALGNTLTYSSSGVALVQPEALIGDSKAMQV